MFPTSSVEQWFQRDGETVWHVNSVADPTSLCGVTRMRSNVDNTADALPFQAAPCAPCIAIRDRNEPLKVEPAPRATRRPKNK